MLQKKETPTEVFSSGFWEIFKNIFFTEHLRVTASLNHKDFLYKVALWNISLKDIWRNIQVSKKLLLLTICQSLPICKAETIYE